MYPEKEDSRKPTALLRRGDMHPNFGFLPLSDQDGWRRSSLRGANETVITGTNVKAAITVIPSGQASPPHTWSGEHIMCGLAGIVEFVIDGDVFLLEPQDILFFAEDTIYSYRNVGEEDAAFLSVVGRVAEWPCTGEYILDGRDEEGDMEMDAGM